MCLGSVHRKMLVETAVQKSLSRGTLGKGVCRPDVLSWRSQGGGPCDWCPMTVSVQVLA